MLLRIDCLTHLNLWPSWSNTVDMERSPWHGEPAGRQFLVLVVDDNEDNLLLLAFVLEQLGCAIVTAANGQTALDLAQRYQPGLILLDMMLPDMDGIEVFSHLKQQPQTTTIPVIAVTALARREDQERILAAGFNEYISKPFVIDELEELLRPYLGQFN